MQKSLYDQNPAAWDRIAATHPALAQMAKLFHHEALMAVELGLTERAIQQWVAGANGIFPMRERQARTWLSNRNATASHTSKTEPSPQSGVVLMVACDANTAERVQKVLAMFGCEVVEV